MGLSRTFDYKKIIKSRKARLKILKLFNWIPDKQMIKLQYRIKTGRKLDLKNPRRYTEKIQWYKLYYRDPLMAKCADKYLVRDYVENKGLGHILNDIYGVYDDVSEIDFNELPNQFVFKKTNGGGGNDIIICKDKSKFDLEAAKKIMKEWTKKESNGGGREWVYYKEKPRIIIEKYIKTDDGNLVDYKFYCFNGEPFCVLVIKDRYKVSGIKKGFFTTDFSFIDIGLKEYDFVGNDGNRINMSPPQNYKEMLIIAKKLSEDFPHVRVDLYNIKGKVLFGELTFYDASGYIDYGEFDFILGEQFKLPEKKL